MAPISLPVQTSPHQPCALFGLWRYEVDSKPSACSELRLIAALSWERQPATARNRFEFECEADLHDFLPAFSRLSQLSKSPDRCDAWGTFRNGSGL